MSGPRARGLILQHGADGPPGILGEWLTERAIEHEVHSTWRDPLPERPEDYGWIATLGSEHTPGAPGAPAWVDDEIAFLRAGLAAETPVLGLCFGGQALAVAAGGSVLAAEPAQIGWIEIETDDPDLIPPGPWVHHHYDQLQPPAAATTLATSAAGPAAFTLGRSLGVQFHPEATPAIATKWARLGAARLAPMGIDQAQLAAEGERAGPGAARAARRLFDTWWERIRA